MGENLSDGMDDLEALDHDSCAPIEATENSEEKCSGFQAASKPQETEEKMVEHAPMEADNQRPQRPR